MVQILDSLLRLENKVDALQVPLSNPYATGSPTSLSWDYPARLASDGQTGSAGSRSKTHSTSRNRCIDPLLPEPYKHVTAEHKILRWPAIQNLLQQSNSNLAADIRHLTIDGPGWLLSIMRHSHMEGLPLDERVPDQPFLGMQRDRTDGLRVIFPGYPPEAIHQLCTIYFDSYNLVYPILDRQTFFDTALARIVSEGFGTGDTDSALTLLVMSLGKLASESSLGPSINSVNGRPSGIRGGSGSRPPGLDLFNEARARMGFTMTQCQLENVQILSLAGLVWLWYIPSFSVLSLFCSPLHADCITGPARTM
jgi:hypothetical protein